MIIFYFKIVIMLYKINFICYFYVGQRFIKYNITHFIFIVTKLIIKLRGNISLFKLLNLNYLYFKYRLIIIKLHKSLSSTNKNSHKNL